MKRTTYIVEITTQKNEKYLSEGRNQLACLLAYLLTLCQLRNFLCEFTEKCFAILHKFFLFYLLYDFWILVQIYQSM